MKPIPLHHVWTYTDVDRDFWQEHLADWLPRRIFDAHTHVTEPEFRRKAPTEAKRHEYWVNEINDPIGAAAAARCREIVLPDREFSCLAFGMPDLDYDIDRSNARAVGRAPAAAGIAWRWSVRSGRPSAWSRN